MKYKIQEIEFEDGHKEFVPLVKLHWWSPWKCVYSWGELTSIDRGKFLDSLDEAKHNISRFVKGYRENKVKGKRDIDVKINIVEDEDNVQ